MTESALDLARRAATRPLGDARDAQAKAIARARLIRDEHKLGSRGYHDANAVVEDLEQVGRHLDSIGAALARPAGATAAPSPPKGYTTPPAPKAEANGKPPGSKPFFMSLDQVREHAAAGCKDCQASLASIEGDAPQVVSVAVGYMRDQTLFRPATHDRGYPTANGAAVTDRAG